MPLFLLRHGQTVFNVAGRYQGQNDSNLTEIGVQQARRNGEILAARINDISRLHFVSSPLGRTLATSELICKTLGIDGHDVRSLARPHDQLFELGNGQVASHGYPALA